MGSNSNHSPTYRVLICSALKRFGLIPRPFGRLVGSSGLEPPTSRLSGARSNHLSYEPIQFSVYLFSSLAFGGDDGNRTHDPLLAGQVLSQLSYTPINMRLSFLFQCLCLAPSALLAVGTADRSLKIEQQVMSTPLKCTLAVFLVFAYFQTTTDQILCIYLSRSP